MRNNVQSSKIQLRLWFVRKTSEPIDHVGQKQKGEYDGYRHTFVLKLRLLQYLIHLESMIKIS